MLVANVWKFIMNLSPMVFSLLDFGFLNYRLPRAANTSNTEQSFRKGLSRFFSGLSGAEMDELYLTVTTNLSYVKSTSGDQTKTEN
jgi:hypothetical protein